MRRLLPTLCLSLALLTPALAQAPAAPVGKGAAPAQHKRNFTLRGEGLTIKPNMESIYLRFDGGVTISGQDFKLEAANVELNIRPTELLSSQGIKLPSMPAGSGDRLVDDPGQVAAEMARELKLPEPRFSASAIQRVAASGGIVARTQGLTLRTPQLVSTDGGRSWAAEGRSTIVRSADGETYNLAADHLVYDTQAQRAVARGDITASFRQRGQPEVKLAAQRLELDVKAGRITVAEGLSAQYGDIRLTSTGLTADTRGQALETQGEMTARMGDITLEGGALSADLQRQTLSTAGRTRLTDTGRGLSLDAGALSVGLKDETVQASGGVKLTDTARDVAVEAAAVTVDMQQRSIAASGQATVRYGSSTFTGERISVRQDGDRTIVEVEGEQTARLNVDELQQKLEQNGAPKL